MRPKKFDVTDALEKALLTFWHKGYQGASMQNLLDSMHLGRASMYHTFGNKEALFGKVIDRYAETRCEKWMTALHSGSNSKAGIENLTKEIIRHATAKKNPGGCLVAQCLSEDVQFTKETEHKLNETYNRLNKAIVLHLQQGIKRGDFQKITDANELSLYLLTLFLGIMSLSKIKRRGTDFNPILKQAMDTISLYT